MFTWTEIHAQCTIVCVAFCFLFPILFISLLNFINNVNLVCEVLSFTVQVYLLLIVLKLAK